MEEIIAYRQELLSALLNVADELFVTVADTPARTWHLSFGPDWHTPHYMLSHLKEVETRMFIPNLYRIQARDNPLLTIFDDEAWMLGHYQPQESATKVLEEFTKSHQQQVGWLSNLGVESWSRIARHPWWGLRTLQWWVELELEFSQQEVEKLTTQLRL